MCDEREYLQFMRITLNELRQIIKKTLAEARGAPSGALRPVKKGERSGSGQKFKIGKTEDDNRELSAAEAEAMFPESTEAWAEVVPQLYPDFPFSDPVAVTRASAWFKIGNELRVAFRDMPQIELAKWSPGKADWVEMNAAEGDLEGVTDADDSGSDDFESIMKGAYAGTLPRPVQADTSSVAVGQVPDEEDSEFDDLDSPLMKAYHSSLPSN